MRRRLGLGLFVVGVVALVLAASHGHHPAATAPVPAGTSSTGGPVWLLLPGGVLALLAVAIVLVYRRGRPRPASRVHEHWHVILNAQPRDGGPWVVVRRGYREQRAVSREQVAASVEAEARTINPRLRYRADVVEAQPVATGEGR